MLEAIAVFSAMLVVAMCASLILDALVLRRIRWAVVAAHYIPRPLRWAPSGTVTVEPKVSDVAPMPAAAPVKLSAFEQALKNAAETWSLPAHYFWHEAFESPVGFSEVIFGGPRIGWSKTQWGILTFGELGHPDVDEGVRHALADSPVYRHEVAHFLSNQTCEDVASAVETLRWPAYGYEFPVRNFLKWALEEGLVGLKAETHLQDGRPERRYNVPPPSGRYPSTAR